MITKALNKIAVDAMEGFPVEVKVKFSSHVYIIKPAPPKTDTLAILLYVEEAPDVVKVYFENSDGRHLKEYDMYDVNMVEDIKKDLRDHVRLLISF